MKLLTLAALMAANISHAAVLRNDVNTTIRLGYGIDTDIAQVFDGESCVEFDPNNVVNEDSRNPNEQAPTHTKLFNVAKEVVSSSLQMDEYTHTSVSASINYMVASAGYSMDDKQVSKLKSDQVAVGIKVDADYGRWYLKNVKLKPEMARLAQRDLQAFFAKCGHEYVSGFKLGQGLKVLMTTVSRSSFYRHDRTEEFNADVGSGDVSAKVNATIQQSAMQLLNYGSLQVKVTGYGNSGISVVSDILRNEGEVKKFVEQVSKMVSDMTTNSAVKSAYVTSRYPGIPSSAYDPMLAQIKYNTYQSLFSDFRKVLSDLERLRLIARNGFAGQFWTMCNASSAQKCQEYGNYINYLIGINEQALRDINSAARKCVKAVKAEDCVSTSVWVVNPVLGELQKSVKWPYQFRKELYQAELDMISKR